MIKKLLILAFYILSNGLFVNHVVAQSSNVETLHIHTSSGIVPYQIELALTPEQQKTGLMYRKYLPPQQGMLFIFKSERIAHMWMENTLISLDMIFFDKEGRVVELHKNAKPLDRHIISTQIPVAGVLEINAGEAEKFGIDINAQLKFIDKN